ncbi:MAG: cation:proton antiporter [Planctomycetota bacterium]|nr:MAG: cation:proton antiporter [Planctomycetota bacterium]
MNETHHELGWVLLLIGGMVVLSLVIKDLASRLRIPPLVGFIGLGMLVRAVGDQGHFLSEHVAYSLQILGNLGLIALLFRVGLESDLRGLLSQAGNAALIWVGDVGFSGMLGFLVARYVAGLELAPSAIVGTALSVTSVGVSVGIWHAAGLLRSKQGEVLIDVAELDDITGIILMAGLFAVLPAVAAGDSVDVGRVAAVTLAWVLFKLFLLVGVCLVFSLFFEERLTRLAQHFDGPHTPTLMMVGVGIVVASGAELLGISAAIGAFLAGIAYSRDPQAVRLETAYGEIYELFAPFFFVNVGLNVSLHHAGTAAWLGGILLVAAAAGKFFGVAIPAWTRLGAASAVLLGVSMIPRAEIAMVIMQRGTELGEWAVPPEVFSAMVIVSAGTCLVTPFVLSMLFKKLDARRRLTFLEAEPPAQ